MLIKDLRPIVIIFFYIVSSQFMQVCWTHMHLNFILNLTPSVPKGIYQVRSIMNLRLGNLIIFNLPNKLKRDLATRPWVRIALPLIKPVGALPGDTVCNLDEQIVINNLVKGQIHAFDYQGRSLPQLDGCFRIKSDEFLPLSTYNDRSFDGRYFGPIKTDAIIGEAIPILTW